MQEAVTHRIADLQEQLRSALSKDEEQRSQLKSALEENKETLNQLTQATMRIDGLQQEVDQLTKEVMFEVLQWRRCADSLKLLMVWAGAVEVPKH